MLRTAELLDAADIGKLRPRWEGPFRVTALAGPTGPTPTVNVDRLKPYFARKDQPAPPGPRVSDPGQEGEYEVELILNRRTFRGSPFYLVRWQGSTSDSWEPVEHLKN